MSHPLKAPPPIERLVAPATYAEMRSHLFASETAVRWFIRMNRPALVKRGGFTIVNGRLFIDRDKFDRVVLEVGQRAANGD